MGRCLTRVVIGVAALAALFVGGRPLWLPLTHSRLAGKRASKTP
jgi:hypothetical protein